MLDARQLRHGFWGKCESLHFGDSAVGPGLVSVWIFFVSFGTRFFFPAGALSVSFTGTHNKGWFLVLQTAPVSAFGSSFKPVHQQPMPLLMLSITLSFPSSSALPAPVSSCPLFLLPLCHHCLIIYEVLKNLLCNQGYQHVNPILCNHSSVFLGKCRRDGYAA